ncbi:MAG: 2OG-Fe(II) oxygenase [Rhizobiaceae bacterium]|nr:2OG-Fe(II) oxygenase [Rhizobiaceae bacterium]
MPLAPAFSFHRKQYEQQGFTILLNAARPVLLRQMARIIERACEEDFIEGDESEHSWKEIAIDPPLALSEMIAGFDVKHLLGGQLGRSAHWLNIYEPGEFIGAHVDAGGDMQIMIPIEMPPPFEGGELWVNDKECILPVALGDVLLFAAHRVRHGTTAVRSGRRVSFNGRMWLRDSTSASGRH